MALFRKEDAAGSTNVREPRPVTTTSPPTFMQEPELRTSLGEDAVVTGKLSFTTPTRIDGTLKGEVKCTRLLVIGETARVEGNVEADDLRVHGRIEGDIVRTRRVEISSTGSFSGKLECKTFVLHDGGRFDGECSMS